MADNDPIAQEVALVALFIRAQSGDRDAYNQALQGIYSLVESFYENYQEVKVASMKTIRKSRHTSWLQPGFADLVV